jgi:hypothetical protein
MECKCGSQSGEYKSGVSSKTGKPYKGWKCSACNLMTWIKDQTPSKNYPDQSSNPLVELMKRNNELLVKILNAVSTKMTVEKEELQPDSDTPF